jgi:hypothetical protein
MAFGQSSENQIMAKKSVNKTTLVREYLAKYPEKGPTAIAQQIAEEKGVKISGKHVGTIKAKLKQASGSVAVAAKPTTLASTPAKKKKAPSRVQSTPAKSAPVAASAAALSQHIANLKAAAQRLGKEEAKRIIDLF